MSKEASDPLSKPLEYYSERYDGNIIALPGGNYFLQVGEGQNRYLTEHIPREYRRDLVYYWDEILRGSFQSAFRDAWPVRFGTVELVANLAEESPKELDVVLMNAGIGSYTAAISCVPNVRVTHVEASRVANELAKKHILEVGIPSKTEVVEATSLEFLTESVTENRKVDVLFFYGRFAEDTPEEAKIIQATELGANILADGGHIWFVCCEQLMLLDPTDRSAVDLKGEYPPRAGFAEGILRSLPDMTIIRQTTREIRPDYHPYIRGHGSIAHDHCVYRAVLRKGSGQTPEVGLKKPVDPNWQTRWEELKRNALQLSLQ